MDTHTKCGAGPSKVTMEGTYSPADYFEDDVVLDRRTHRTIISDGRIKVTLHEFEPLPDPDCQSQVSRELLQVFQAQAILTGVPFEVTGLTLKRRFPDGTAEISVSASSSFTLSDSVNGPDLVLTDRHGNLIRDTKAERIDDARAFRKQIQRHGENLLLQRLIASLRRAVADPENRMTHLYEVRDALARHFGSDQATRDALGLTRPEWSDLGRIANHEPIVESRHRGMHDALRPATDDEKTRALGVTRRMLRAYLDHLDRSVPPV